MAEKKHPLEMIGEALRDIGILLLVFVPLDALFADKPPGWRLPSLLLTIGAASIVGGIEIERRRK